uniref:Caspase family p20 domain-containing protein n=1 Tax=Strigamia maritima TaxID=126957 RepID=T1JIT9_STRMM
MKKQLTNLAEENHVNSNCIIICILSHGEEGRVIGVDGQMISIDKDVVAEFTSKSSLAGKPKLFFIQACQGNDRLRPVSEPVESGENSLPPLPINDNLSPDSAADLASDAVASHPAKSDYLLCLPTVEGYAAYRNKNSGTWFIMTLVEKLRLFGCKEDIMTIMRRVNNQVADAVGKIDGEKVKQQPVQKTTLRKQLIFKKKNKKNI